jgi:hypothetical protein
VHINAGDLQSLTAKKIHVAATAAAGIQHLMSDQVLAEVCHSFRMEVAGDRSPPKFSGGIDGILV